jgi:hypothetical protein
MTNTHQISVADPTLKDFQRDLAIDGRIILKYFKGHGSEG